MAGTLQARYAVRMVEFTRRGFLSRAALAGGALVLPSGLLTTVGGGCAPTSLQRRTDHYFVFYFMIGGWDLMLSTDAVRPKDGLWIPYEEDEVVTVGDHRFGPAMQPLVPFMDKMGILKGIYVDALNHPQARFRMVTGRFKPPGNNVPTPSVQTLIAQVKGAGYELPNLSSDQLRPASFRGDIPDQRLEPVRVSSIDQLRGLVGLKGDVARYRKEVEEALRKKDALTTREWGDGELARAFEGYADLSRDLSQSDYRQRVKNASSVVEGATQAMAPKADVAGRQIRLAVEAVRQDLAPCITIGSGEFDAHIKTEYAGHPTAVKNGFKNVAAICQGLQDTVLDDGTTLLDRTTVVVGSEFSRTPSKNELGGKHHWPTNSWLFIGKGVRRAGPGMPFVFGQTDDSLRAVPVNPQTGSTKRGTEDLEMTHGLATILAMAGIDPVPHVRQEPIGPLLG